MANFCERSFLVISVAKPASTSMTRSAYCNKRGSWVTTQTALPLRARLTSSCMTVEMELASSDAVGSSHNTNCGSVTSARAIATRCCWPPESCLGKLFFRSSIPTSSSASSAFCLAVALGSFFSCNGIMTLSRALSGAIKLKLWKTKPMVCRRNAASSFWLSSLTNRSFIQSWP